MRVMKWLLLILLIASALIVPTHAQQRDDNLIRVGLFGNVEEIGYLIPGLCRSAYACEIADILFPRLIGVDPETQNFASGAPGNSLAMTWKVSPDGLEYTFTLREDMFWSDGEQVDAEDVVFTFEANGYYGYIQSVEAVDQFTVRLTVSRRSCTTLFDANIGILPAHAFDYSPANVYETDFGFAPSVAAGPFLFESLDIEANQLLLRANSKWPGGEVQSDGLLLIGTSTPDEATDRLLAGELDVTDLIPQRRFKEVRTAEGVQFSEFPGTDWDYIGLNLADPARPRDGVDFDGSIIDQGSHPIFGDVRVRQAMQYALDVQAILDRATYGEATIMPSYEIPLSWAFDAGLKPVPFNQQEANRLLDEAGWVMGADGVRVAATSDYANPGTPLRFVLVTNGDNPRREMVAEMVQQQLAVVGVDVEVQLLDFNEVLVLIDSQTFDAVLLGWGNYIPDDPSPELFLPFNDVEGISASNFISYYNEDIIDLELEADLAENCEPSVRNPIYHEIQAIVQQDQPYLWLFALNRAFAAGSSIEGFAPYPNMLYENAYQWRVRE